MWIMVMVLVIGKNEVILKPYDIFDDRILCLTWKADAERETHVPMACIQEREV